MHLAAFGKGPQPHSSVKQVVDSSHMFVVHLLSAKFSGNLHLKRVATWFIQSNSRTPPLCRRDSHAHIDYPSLDAAPPGMPGSHPDDFTGMGPSREDGWHDIGPPPGGFPGRGSHMPGRRGRGGFGSPGGLGGPGGFGAGGFI